jgi:hypothetical protein
MRGEATARWEIPVEIQVRAVVLANNVLFVAGPRAEQGKGPDNRAEDRAALLIAISASDGAELARYKLDSSPVFDGMAAANSQLYLSLVNGQVLCMAGRQQTRVAIK